MRPAATFRATPTSGRAPLAVTFTDESTNNPRSWLWKFGDGISSMERNPSHTYMKAGKYTVMLTVSNAFGSDEETKKDYIAASNGVIAFPGYKNLPTDPDGDGLFEDTTGNGYLDFEDDLIYFQNLQWIPENEPVPLFDYSGNGEIDFKDVQLLFGKT